MLHDVVHGSGSPHSSVTASPLPKFDRPPVHEVVLAAYFAPLGELRSYHYGELAALWRDEYPNVEDQPAQPEITDDLFDSSPPASGIQIVDMDPLPRCWFINSNDDMLIQVQRERLVHNWRRRDGNYPSYSALRPRFVSAYTVFADFVARNNLGPLKVMHAEVAYVNPIPVEGPLEAVGALDKLIAPLSGGYSDDFLPPFDLAGVGLQYDLPGEDRPVGRLNVRVGPAEGPDGKVVLMGLLARGEPIGEGLEGVLAFHDLAHEWIVRGFKSLTTPEMHTYWGNTQ